MLFSTMASANTAFASDTSSPQDNVIGGTGITITIDENGNIISAINTADKNQSNDNKEEVSMNSPASDKNNDDGETSVNNNSSVNNLVLPDKFDKYYTLINNDAVKTNTLFMQTFNSNIVNKNNIMSHYDDIYIITFSSIEEAKYAYSYYVDKVDFISDLSDSIVLMSNEVISDNTSNSSIANLNKFNISDYSGYIALIDSGANGADASVSLFDDDGKDTLGHGTLMYNLIKAENPDAKILSIKAFEDRTTNVVNLYKAIKMAIEANVAVINLSLAGYDIDKNAIIIDVIKEALDKEITVVGAAGNYNASALNYIPGCIDDVITVGAIYSNKTKYKSSNYDADVYVVANSTSEATARYTGMLTANNIDETRTTAELVDKSNYPTVPDDGDENAGKGPAGTHSDKKAA